MRQSGGRLAIAGCLLTAAMMAGGPVGGAESPDAARDQALSRTEGDAPSGRGRHEVSAAERAAEDRYTAQRIRMVEEQLMGSRDGRLPVTDPRVLDVMRQVPRHKFMPAAVRDKAYDDHPLPIGEDQTISQPYIVALMTQLAAVDAADTVLEIGTGSGYQAAVLAQLARVVYTIEIIEPLARQAQRTLKTLGVKNVFVRVGDGYRGWPEAAPFDAIVVTAAAPRIPEPLIEQLATGGRLVLPVGEAFQQLIVVTKTPTGLSHETVIPVRFVPMVGEIQRPSAPATRP